MRPILFVCFLLLPSVLLSSVDGGYGGPLGEADSKLVVVFIERAGLLARQRRFAEVVLELKTAERILARRSLPLRRRLAAAYIEAAEGYLFYYEIQGTERAASLPRAEICLRSAVALDPDCYAKARPLLVALYNRQAAAHADDAAKLEESRRSLLALGERSSEADFRKQLLAARAEEERRAARQLDRLLAELEAGFVQALKHYRLAETKVARDNYGPLRESIERILRDTPNPPASKFLFDLIEKHQARREYSEVMRLPR